MERTKNYNLLKPGGDDFYDVDDFNTNADIVDEEFKRVEKSVGEVVEKLDKKVDKASGKELSTNDFTDTDKQQIQDNKKDIATLQDNQYIHPTYASRFSGLYKVAVDNSGHVNAVTPITKADITALGIPGQEQISNKNLLLNWDFRNPVNQRGQESYGRHGYTIDRWYINGSDIFVAVNSDYIAMKGYLTQKIENPSPYIGTYTASIKIKSTYSGNAHIYMYDAGYLGSKIFTSASSGEIISITFTTSSAPTKGFSFNTSSDTPINIESVKLELGPISTLANDPPANYGEQLALCQRYYEHIEHSNSYGLGVIMLPNTANFILPYMVNKRIAPTLTFGNPTGFHIEHAGGSCIVSGMQLLEAELRATLIQVTVATDEMIPGQCCTLRRRDSHTDYINFDAEIY